MSRVQNLTTTYSQHRFAVLFITLLFTLVAAPVLAALGISTMYMEVFLVLNILAAVLITYFTFWSYLGLGLLALLLAARVANALLDIAPLLVTSQGATILAFLITVFIMFRYILSEGCVNAERIFAALNTYLLFGIACGLLFFIFEEKWPGSLSIQGLPEGTSRQVLLAHTIYFSFVSLGTVGYGDIVPVGGPARALAVAEAIGGQMYLVVVVARLVSLYQASAECADRGRRDKASGLPGDS